MRKSKERFVRVYSQGSGLGMHIQIWVDKVTGVNYTTRVSATAAV